jgi:hypothetical protein
MESWAEFKLCSKFFFYLNLYFLLQDSFKSKFPITHIFDKLHDLSTNIYTIIFVWIFLQILLAHQNRRFSVSY